MFSSAHVTLYSRLLFVVVHMTQCFQVGSTHVCRNLKKVRRRYHCVSMAALHMHGPGHILVVQELIQVKKVCVKGMKILVQVVFHTALRPYLTLVMSPDAFPSN